MRTTSSLHRSVLRAGLVALVLLVVGFAGALPAVANPGIDEPGFAPGGDGPPPPDPPPPGPQDEGIPEPPPDEPPPPPPPGDDGAGGGSGGAPSGGTVETVPVPEVEPIAEDSVVPADGETEVAEVPDADRTSSSALKVGFGLMVALLATAAGLLLLIGWRRRHEEDTASAS
jgi:hypothetical protein